MPGTTDGHVVVGRKDLSFLRLVSASKSGSFQVMPGVVPLEVARLVELGLLMLIGGRACITARGICAVEARPVMQSERTVTIRGVDLC
ncbi:hypothetical protein [Planctomyces sp. SH-PL14]|jgi:hypothetical protein|uniref:hypothetical protein n=1 Tax=Planctomyces sp. SH-PL14 TaxID=1632864 RepID=UPI00078E9708|nr:hypothetical protein [Planctomyces sp. SH-PL14]AMV16496.1 hypothetical protein VT03_01310 [Planctomyces sp. SH-PL14]